MATIDERYFKVYQDGTDRMSAAEYMRERETFRLAINDLEEKVRRAGLDQIEGISANLAAINEAVNQSIAESTSLNEQTSEQLEDIITTVQELRDNGTGIDAKAREDIEKANIVLAEKANREEVRLKTQKISQIDATEEFLQQMAGDTPVNAVPANKSITSEKYADSSILKNHLRFIKMSSNLFNIKTITRNAIISATGVINPSEAYAYSEFIPVQPNTAYSFRAIYSIAEYKADQLFIKRNSFNIPTDYTFTTGSNTYWIRANIQPDLTSRGNPTLNLGSTLLDYEEFYEALDGVGINMESVRGNLPLSKLSEPIPSTHRTPLGIRGILVTPTHLANIQERKLIFSGTSVRVIYGKKTYSVTFEETLEISLPSQHNYVFFDTINNRFETITTVNSFPNVLETYIFVAFVSYTSIASDTLLNVDYPGEYLVNGKSRFAKDEVTKSTVTTYTEPIPTEWYKAPEVESYQADTHYVDTIKQSDVYTVYDSLVENNPEWVTKIEMGKDSSNNYTIYRYEFKTPVIEATKAARVHPKIIIFTGTHGEEKSSVIGLRNFMRDVGTNWKNNSLLEFVRFNVDLVIIPIVNPHGFVSYRRKNKNGVDINRNSSKFWELSNDTDPTGQSYKGTAPFSEVETQYVRDTILAHKDAIACFDYHMNGSSGNEWRTLFWHSIGQFSSEAGFEELNIIARNNIAKITREAQKRYDVPLDSGPVGYVSYSNNLPTLTAYAYSEGVPGFTIECTRRFVGETGVYSAKTMKICTEYIGNHILNVLRELK